jgi:type III secretion system low calcium response chaperone LcrH/SycD
VKMNRHEDHDESVVALGTTVPDEVAAAGSVHAEDTPAQAPFAGLSASDVDEDALAALMLDAVGDGVRLRDLHGIPAHVMDGIHGYAYDFYQQGRLDEAEAFFRFLCLYDFYNADYATGLAAVFQLQERFRQAIDMYGVAMRLGSDDPAPVFYAGQCFLKLGIPEDAIECFEFVVEHAREASMLERARTYLASIARNGPPSPEAGEPDGLTKAGDET